MKWKRFLRRLLLMDDTVYDDVTPYVVDTTKPPIFPPGRVFVLGIFGERQTDLSRRQSEAWDAYAREYEKKLSQSH